MSGTARTVREPEGVQDWHLHELSARFGRAAKTGHCGGLNVWRIATK